MTRFSIPAATTSTTHRSNERPLPDPVGWLARFRTRIAVAVTLVLVGAGLAALTVLLRTVHPNDVRHAFVAIPIWRLALAAALTAGSYLALTFYDVLALRVIGRSLPWRTAALASFASYTLGHNLGLSLVTGGSARYSVYRAAGLDASDVARIVAIAGATFWMGVFAITGAALAMHPGALPLGGSMVPTRLVRASGVAILVAVGSVTVCVRRVRGLSLLGWHVPLPSRTIAAGQIGIAALDLAFAGGALFVLVPHVAPALLPEFMLAYALAIVATLVSHVPGGIGVFEAVVIATLPGDQAALLAALVAYRIIYYLAPLGIGIAALALHDRPKGVARRTPRAAQAIATRLSPLVMSSASVLGGTILLLSGATPGVPHRLIALDQIVPLPFIEASHFSASLAGTGLLLLAPGLYRRLDGAFHTTRLLLLAGALFSITKGFDYEEAIVCLTIAALLQWTRQAFYRHTTLVRSAFSPRWMVSVAVMVALSVWLGLFSYRHVAYTDGLWWNFAVQNDASRYLRASLGAGILLAAAALWTLFLAPPRRPATGDSLPDDLTAIVAQADHTDAMLAFTGDKRFLVSVDRTAFLMYQVKGASWIVMGNPVGDKARWKDLIWSIRTMADAAQGRLMLYQIDAHMLELAIGTGLRIVKYGEEAVVDLADFSIEGSRMRSIRHAVRRAEREGATFEIIPAAFVPPLLPALAAISDAWLAAKDKTEKAFSLGRFDPGYVARFDCAVVRREGRIVAFANLWRTADGSELSVDLMRHAEPALPGTMDYLFARLMLWGRDQGIARFSLGLAPLAGIEGRQLAPLWARLGAALFDRGERFYGFKGLRAYKEKFSPRWLPRYIAAPGGVGLYLAMIDLNRLIETWGTGRTHVHAAVAPSSVRPLTRPRGSASRHGSTVSPSLI